MTKERLEEIRHDHTGGDRVEHALGRCEGCDLLDDNDRLRAALTEARIYVDFDRDNSVRRRLLKTIDEALEQK